MTPAEGPMGFRPVCGVSHGIHRCTRRTRTPFSESDYKMKPPIFRNLLLIAFSLSCSSGCSSPEVELIISQPDGSLDRRTVTATPLIGSEHMCTGAFSCVRVSNNLYINFEKQFVRSTNLAFGHVLNRQSLETEIEQYVTRSVYWSETKVRYGFCYPPGQVRNCILIEIRRDGDTYVVHQARADMPPEKLDEALKEREWIQRGNTSVLDSRLPSSRIFLIRRDDGLDLMEF